MRVLNRCLKINLILVLCSFILQGCATSGEKKLDEKLSRGMDISNSTDLTIKIRAEIDSDSHLTPEQKFKLIKIEEDTSIGLQKLRRVSLQLRDILVEDFKSQDDAEIDVIRLRLQDVNTRQISLIFDSVEKANKVVGRGHHYATWLTKLLMPSYESQE